MTQLARHRPTIAWEIPDELATTWVISGPAPVPATAAKRRVRNDLLQKVKSYWIQGFLEKSLHNILRLDLGFMYKPEAVSRSWSMALQQINMPEQELPENVSILEVFRQHQRELLILGEPGAGKTITLLELARDLITLAEADETQSIPVVLNLSSWNEQQLPFATWLEEALLHEYQVSRKVGQKWIATDFQLTLLLDGLDEVQKEHRQACVAAINDFRAEHMVDIVICSRTVDYDDLQMRLNISTAIVLRPLTLEQIDAYLAAGGQSLSALRQMLREDVTFQALAQTPLLLSIMAMTYSNQPVSTLQDNSRPSEQRHRLFTKYVQYMFRRQGMTRAQAGDNSRRLSWLAHHMTLRTQSTFSLNMLQKTWLLSKTAQYTFVLLMGIFYWFITTLGVGAISSSYILGAAVGIVVGVVGIAVASEIEIVQISLQERMGRFEIPLKSYFELVQVVAVGLGIGIVGLLNTTLILCISIGVIAGIVYWLIRSRKDVKFFLSQGINRRNLPRILAYIAPDIVVGAGIGFMGHVIGLLAWNSVQIVLLSVLLILMFWLGSQLLQVLGGPLIALGTHIDNHSRHFMLRLLLSLHNTLPWQPHHFLDEMAACGVLRKSGNNYLFIHTLLRDHFASSAQNY